MNRDDSRTHTRLLRVCVGLLAVEAGVAVAVTWGILQTGYREVTSILQPVDDVENGCIYIKDMKVVGIVSCSEIPQGAEVVPWVYPR